MPPQRPKPQRSLKAKANAPWQEVPQRYSDPELAEASAQFQKQLEKEQAERKQRDAALRNYRGQIIARCIENPKVTLPQLAAEFNLPLTFVAALVKTDEFRSTILAAFNIEQRMQQATVQRHGVEATEAAFEFLTKTLQDDALPLVQRIDAAKTVMDSGGKELTVLGLPKASGDAAEASGHSIQINLVSQEDLAAARSRMVDVTARRQLPEKEGGGK